MRRLTIERAALLILFVLLFTLATRIPVDTDTWWHIRSGEHTLTRGMIYTDPFSFTASGQPWINHSWGSQLILYGAWRLAGNVGLALYTSVLATAGMAVVYRMCAGSVYLRAFALVIGAATAAVFWSARPQMVSFLLSAVLLYILYLNKRQHIDHLWFIPALMLLWGNLHAGFSIGFILLFGAIAGEVLGNIFNRGSATVVSWAGVRKLLLVAAVSVGALVINPYGLQILALPFQTVSIGALQNFIQEWNSPNFHGRETWPFIFLLLGVLGAAGGSRERLDWTDFLLVSGTAFLALLAGRNIAVFAVVATPVLTYHLDAILNERGWVLRSVKSVTPAVGRLNLILLAVISLGALVVIIGTLNPVGVRKAQEQYLPVRVTEFLSAEQPPGPMFNSYNWGGYLMFAAPQYPVFVDGRTDMYGDVFLTRWLDTATGGDGWQDTLNEYGINLVVIENGSGLARQLANSANWAQIYPRAGDEDEQAVVFARRGTP
ncbi:MAG: hypothetical protein HXY40_12195 [Chloroflexi bacterium]|nr:hypothetical protein [Chloroflexota bacterium]